MKLNIQLFASGEFTLSKETGDASWKSIQGKIVWKETNQNSSTNTSDVKVELWGKVWTGGTTGKWTCNAKIDGSNIINLTTSVIEIGSDWVKLATATKTGISHNNDGTKSITISGSLKSASSSTSIYGLTSTGSKSVSLDTLHKAPEIINWSIKENNNQLKNIGIPAATFVRYLSQVKVDLTNANYYDGSTFNKMSLYSFDNNLYTKFIDLTENPAYFTPTELYNNLDLHLRLYDSLGGNTLDEDNGWYFTTIDYSKINIIGSVKRVGQTSGQVSISCNGTYFNGSVGNVNQGNTYKPTIKYKYWEYGTQEPDFDDVSSQVVTVDPNNITTNNGNYSITNLNIGSTLTSDTNYFDYEKAYRVKIKVSDNFSSSETTELFVTIGKPIFTEFKDRVDFAKITIQGENPFEVTTDALTITKTSGNSTATGTYAKCGNVVSYDITLSTTASTTSGGDIFVGTVSNYTPKVNTILTGYVGVRPIIASLTTAKVLTVRNASASSLGSGSTPSIRGTFIIE